MQEVGTAEWWLSIANMQEPVVVREEDSRPIVCPISVKAVGTLVSNHLWELNQIWGCVEVQVFVWDLFRLKALAPSCNPLSQSMVKV